MLCCFNCERSAVMRPAKPLTLAFQLSISQLSVSPGHQASKPPLQPLSGASLFQSSEALRQTRQEVKD